MSLAEARGALTTPEYFVARSAKYRGNYAVFFEFLEFEKRLEFILPTKLQKDDHVFGVLGLESSKDPI